LTLLANWSDFLLKLPGFDFFGREVLLVSMLSFLTVSNISIDSHAFRFCQASKVFDSRQGLKYRRKQPVPDL